MKHRFSRFLLLLLLATQFQAANAQTVSLTKAIERQFDRIERDILLSAEAMPEEKYNFSPQELTIKNAEFKGVRSFAGQIMHLATDNFLIWSTVTGEAIRSDIPDVNGPVEIKTKAAILQYLRESFALGRRAIATVTDKNAMELLSYLGTDLPRLDLAFYALTHANEHYGQMVLYLRLCGIVPPSTVLKKAK